MDLDIAFPESSSFSRITEEMCDYNGHMNVLFYFKMFIENLETYYEDDLGFSKEYFWLITYIGLHFADLIFLD